MRTQRNLVRTQRGMVYKFKCALNESALNEVRTQRGIAVLHNGNFLESYLLDKTYRH